MNSPVGIVAGDVCGDNVRVIHVHCICGPAYRPTSEQIHAGTSLIDCLLLSIASGIGVPDVLFLFECETGRPSRRPSHLADLLAEVLHVC